MSAKRCPYCLVGHERRRARYCSANHAHRAQLQRQRGAGKTKRATARTVAAYQARELGKRRWRAIAMGRDVQLHLSAIFRLR